MLITCSEKCNNLKQQVAFSEKQLCMIDQVQKYVTILLSDKNPLRFGRCVMQKRFEKLNSFKSQFDFGIVHKRSCPSPPQSK